MRRPAAAALALPPALLVDLLALVVLLRALHAGRSLAIVVAIVVTLVAWGLIAAVVDALMGRREGSR